MTKAMTCPLESDEEVQADFSIISLSLALGYLEPIPTSYQALSPVHINSSSPTAGTHIWNHAVFSSVHL